MIPRITVGVAILLVLAYVAGARWPGLAGKVGLA